ncbi:hypothetical protein BaRGS_00009947 [Batillaria attramentaria]|uniref:Uncharacterized protein n=1 Tax=Batillaria attramentaria TaxID=370345 RepID=A0ABD0LHH4_9CAEN
MRGKTWSIDLENDIREHHTARLAPVVHQMSLEIGHQRALLFKPGFPPVSLIREIIDLEISMLDMLISRHFSTPAALICPRQKVPDLSTGDDIVLMK